MVRDPNASTRRWTAKARYRVHHEDGSRYGFSFGERTRAALFSRWIGTGRRVLDVGCRDGTLMRHYAAANRVFGCDVDDAALQLCRRAHGLPVVNTDIMQGLPFGDGSFDAAVLGEVLEHVPDPRFLLSEIHRVLRRDGVFVGSVPNALRLRNRLVFLSGRSFETDPTHLHFYSPTDITSLLSSSGFGAIEFAYKESRFLAMSPRLFGNTMLWRARRGDGA